MVINMRKTTTKNTKDTTKKGFDFVSFANTTKDILATTGLDSLQEMQEIIIDQMSSIKDSKLKNKVKTRLNWIDDIIADKEVQNIEDTNQIAMDIINETAITTDSKPVIDKVASKKTTTKTAKKTTTKKKEEPTGKESKEAPKKSTNKDIKPIAIKDMIESIESGKQVYINLDNDGSDYLVVHHDTVEKRLVLVTYTDLKQGRQLDTYICDYTKLNKEALVFHNGRDRDIFFIAKVYTK